MLQTSKLLSLFHNQENKTNIINISVYQFKRITLNVQIQHFEYNFYKLPQEMIDGLTKRYQCELSSLNDYIITNNRQISIGEALTVLNYPTLESICFRCCKIINSPSIHCSTCQKHYHYECIQKVNALNLLLNNKIYTCLSCINKDKCFNCHLLINPTYNEIFTCKTCSIVIHKKCYSINSEQQAYLNQISSSKQFPQSSLLQNQIICSECLLYYGINTVIAEQVFKYVHFKLIQVDHPHPSIVVWIKTHDNNMRNIKTNDKYKRTKYLFQSVETEELLSIYVPPQCLSLKINQVYKLLSAIFEPKSIDDKKFRNKLKNTLILIKKKYIFDSLFWQQPNQSNISKVMLSRFFHLMKFHFCLSTCERNQFSGQFLFCLNDYTIREKALSRCQTIGIVDIYQAKYDQTNNNNQQISLCQIYKLYLKNSKQFLNITNPSQKIFLLTSLFNTIYFVDKTIHPIAIFTNQDRITWWIHKLRKYSSLLNILSLYGPAQYLKYMMSCHFYRGGKHFKNLNFNFNILLVPYENICFLENIGLMKQLFSQFCLLIMDEKMSFQASKIYSGVKNARIKLSNKINYQIKPNYININTNLDSSLQQQASSINESSKYLCQQFYQKYYSIRNQSTILLKQFHRLNILKYIMNHGTTDTQTMKRQISKQQPSCFIYGNSPTREISTQTISEYMCYLMAHLNLYSQIKNNQQGLSTNILSFFFFQYSPFIVKKRIIDLKRMKSLCQRFPNEPFILNNMHKYFQEVNSLYFGGEAWSPPIFDYFLWFGNWKQLFVFEEHWDGNGKFSSLKDHLSGKIMLQIHTQQILQRFIKNRVLQILQFLDKNQI